MATQGTRQVQRCNRAQSKSRGITANSKGGCRCTSPTAIRHLGGHEVQAPEEEIEGRIKREARKKGQRTKRDAGARVCGKETFTVM
jgi:hypothetical protein